MVDGYDHSTSPSFGAAFERSNALFGKSNFVTLPWVGANYDLAPIKMLILLESSNFDKQSEPSSQSKYEWIIGLTATTVDGGRPVRVVTKIARTLALALGGHPFFSDPARVLNAISWGNFVQPFLERNRGNPPEDFVVASRAAFGEMLFKLKPHLIISFSKGRLPLYLRDYAGQQGSAGKPGGGSSVGFPFQIGDSHVLNTAHPSGRFSYAGAVSDLKDQFSKTPFGSAFGDNSNPPPARRLIDQDA